MRTKNLFWLRIPLVVMAAVIALSSARYFNTAESKTLQPGNCLAFFNNWQVLDSEGFQFRYFDGSSGCAGNVERRWKFASKASPTNAPYDGIPFEEAYGKVVTHEFPHVSGCYEISLELVSPSGSVISHWPDPRSTYFVGPDFFACL